MRTVLAKCENCGGALRVDGSESKVDCGYCGVTSLIRHDEEGRLEAPTLRIDPPPPLESGEGGAWFLTLLMLGLSALFVVGAALTSASERAVPIAGALVGLFVAVFFAFLISREKRLHRARQWFRNNGIPGRATVRGIRAGGADERATLVLEVEVAGREARELEHATVVPALLIPRLVQGLSLPVIVHPDDGAVIQIQWHLL